MTLKLMAVDVFFDDFHVFAVHDHSTLHFYPDQLNAAAFEHSIDPRHAL